MDAPLAPTAGVAVSAGAFDPEPARYRGDSVARLVVARDLFRIERRPASTPYTAVPGVSGVTGAAVPSIPKPPLRLVGLVMGRLPTAVIEGLPGTDTPRAVRVGDLVAGLTVRAIRDSTVVIAGMDTVWVLTVRPPSP